MRISKLSRHSEWSKRRNCNDFKVKLASNFSELQQAFGLAYHQYLKFGYTDFDESQMRYSVLELLPVSQTFIAFGNQQPVGTGTIVFDSKAGLPSTHIFAEELDQLREGGKLIAEGTLLACVDFKSVRAHKISHELIRLALCWCAVSGIDRLCVVVHPKHVRFWHEQIGFEVYSDLKDCSHVKGSPGVLLVLDLHKAGMNIFKPSEDFQKMLLSRWIEAALSSDRYILSEQEVTDLLLKQPAIVATLSSQQRELLQKYYPKALLQAEESVLPGNIKEVA